MSNIDKIKLFDCPKCKEKSSIKYKVKEIGEEVEITLYNCKKCDYESDLIEIFGL